MPRNDFISSFHTGPHNTGYKNTLLPYAFRRFLHLFIILHLEGMMGKRMKLIQGKIDDLFRYLCQPLPSLRMGGRVFVAFGLLWQKKRRLIGIILAAILFFAL